MDISQFNIVDWILVAAVVYGAIRGAWQGLSKELGSLLGVIITVLITRLYYEPISAWIADKLEWNLQLVRLVAVVLLMVVGLYLMRVLRLGLGVLMSFAFKGWLEKVGGMVAGMIRQFLYCMVVLLIVSFIPWSTTERAVGIDSQIGKTMLPYLQAAYNSIAEKVDMISVEIPKGVEEPRVIMPPVVQEAIDDYWPSR